MLTKDHLKYRVYRGRILPHRPKFDLIKDFINELLEIFRKAKGESWEEVQRDISSFGNAFREKDGFVKLLWDRSELGGVDSSLAEKRWETILLAESLRRERLFSSQEEYRASVLEEMGEKSLENMYEDLPEDRKVLSFEDISVEDLYNLYLCSQYQGIIFFSKKIKFSIKNVSIKQKRSLFRAMKFHQLLPKFLDQDTYEISGPLSLLEGSRTYGIKLATFFPYFLHLQHFTLEAEIFLKGKSFSLECDESLGLKSHYAFLESKIPEELDLLLKDYSEIYPGYSLSQGSEFINLGKNFYSFPDYEVQSPCGKKVYVECFHPWHYETLESRFIALEKKIAEKLILGVSRKIPKKKLDFLKNYKLEKIFFFKDFPTAKMIHETAFPSF